MSGPLQPDRDQLAHFVDALFPYAQEGGRVSFRAFFDDDQAKKRNDPPYKIRTVRLNGGGLGPIIDAAYKLACEAAEATRPVVVCPPIATFGEGGAAEKNLLEGLVLSIEADERAQEGVEQLRQVIGTPTLVVASGGLWTDAGTGEVQDKLHAHWRLSEPTCTLEEHAKLKRARSLACAFIGADGTSKPMVHPMRWAGTLHRKNPDAPRLARIVEENPEAEIAIEDALAELEGLAALRGEFDEGQATPGSNPTADGARLAAVAAMLTNPLPPKASGGAPRGEWADWNRIGMAFWRASEGSEAGFAAFDAFSRKSPKYDADATRARWQHFTKSSPPTSIGMGALVYEARLVDPSFLKPKRVEPPPSQEPDEERSSPEQSDDWEAKLAAAIEELNGRYFVAALSGKGVIGSLTYDDTLHRERLVFSRRQDIILLYNHRHYLVGFTQKGSEIWKDLGTAWLEDWRRQTYDRIALIPKGPTPAGVFNLWRGFGVQPAAGHWPLLREHLLNTVCSGNEAHCRYLIGWCAYCVQHPEKQAEVAVVLRGEKGTGKGTVGQALISIFRNHALHIVHSRHLTGHFNAHLVDALFLFLDEAFWGRDKQGEGVLKALITERTVMIEPKGVDPFSMPNRLKILMASNADWVVPASADERRYFVLDVSNERQGDLAYFERLHQALGQGELAAFLDYLLGLDLTGFNIRAVPHTKALNRQKLVSADSVTAFWLDCLREGALPAMGSSGWPADVVTQVLHALYLDHARDHGERHPVTDARMVERLQELWVGCNVRRVRSREAHGEVARPQRYVFASLEQHRDAFLKAMKIAAAEHEWPVNEGGDDAGH